MDTFVYFHAVNPENSITEAAQNQAAEWLRTYDVIICLEPEGGVDIQDDGIRAQDEKYLSLIQSGFRNVIDKYALDIKDKILFCNSAQVFDSTKRENLVNLVEARMQKPVLV